MWDESDRFMLRLGWRSGGSRPDHSGKQQPKFLEALVAGMEMDVGGRFE